MMNFPDRASIPSDYPAPWTDRLRLAVAAYLARFTGPSRQHTTSDLRRYLSWSLMDVLLDAWDTKPNNRIRRTSPHPAPTRTRSY
jgi:hypothetical protein